MARLFPDDNVKDMLEIAEIIAAFNSIDKDTLNNLIVIALHGDVRTASSTMTGFLTSKMIQSGTSVDVKTVFHVVCGLLMHIVF